MRKIRHPEDLTPEEFAILMENDPVFRKEMLRRQQAAIAMIEATQRGRKYNHAHSRRDIPHDIVEEASACSQHWIQHASISQLLKAVKAKRLSLARYKIEIKRRKNSEYYDNLPDVDIGQVNFQ